MASAQRPRAVHSLSAQFRLHRRSNDERAPLLDTHARNTGFQPISEETASQAPEVPLITVDDEDLEGEASEHADSDGLYPPHCCWTAANDGVATETRERADLFGTKQCNVYLNIHRYVHGQLAYQPLPSRHNNRSVMRLTMMSMDIFTYAEDGCQFD
jgi:hypothetical protein